MSDEQGLDPQVDTNQDDGDNDLFPRDYVQQLRQESARHRTERNALRDELAKLKTEAQQRQEQELAEQNKWQELAEQRARELESYKQAKERLDSLTTEVSKRNEERIAGLPERVRPVVPEYDDPFRVAEWLDHYAEILPATAPSLDGAAGRAKRPAEDAMRATEDEIRYAQKMGVSLEDYLKNKRKT